MLPGIYPADVIQTWVLKKDNEKKTPYVKIKAEVYGDEPQVQTVFIEVYISKAALGMARRQLKLVGFDIDKEPIHKLENGSEHLKGTRFEVECYEDTYNDKTRTKYRIP